MEALISNSGEIGTGMKVKGMSKTLKRGSRIRNARLAGNPEHIEYRIGKSTIVLKTPLMEKV